MRALNIGTISLHPDGSVATPSGNANDERRIKGGVVPVISEAIMAANGEFEMRDISGGWLHLYSADPDAFSVKVKRDSLFPRINSGEFVVIEPGTPVCPRDEVFIRTVDGKNMIKRLGYYRDNTYQFISVNQQQPPLTLDDVNVEKVDFVAAIVKSSRYIDNVTSPDAHV